VGKHEGPHPADGLAVPERRIVGFHRDGDGTWVAELECGHRQHLHHKPPFQNRSWVRNETQRNEHLGQRLSCRYCLMPELPPGAEIYKTTPELDETTVPQGLLASHRLKAGTWGRIVVREGSLLYTIEQPRELSFVLTPTLPGTVAPEVPHHVKPDTPVRFHIEFLRVPP
jgi:tellurite resistance-related uncharacterized protein